MAEKGDPNQREKYQKALMELIGCRPVAYWPYLARRVGGAKSAIMLSQLLYWNGDVSVIKRDGWILKSVEGMEEETGLTKLEQQTARKMLKDLGIVDSILKGIPRIWHYRIDMDLLAENLIGEVSHSMGNPSNGKPIQRETHSTGKPANIGQKTDPTLGSFPTQLNNELKTTSLKTTDKTTSSSSEAPKRSQRRGKKQEEEGSQVGSLFSPSLLEKLKGIGVFDDRLPEIAAKGWSDEQLLALIQQAAAEDREHTPGSVAKLFIYRLRQLSSPPLTSTEMEAEERKRRYAKYDTED